MSDFETNLTFYNGSDKNFTGADIPPDIIELFILNRRVSGSAYYVLSIAYGLLIIVGTCGNILVVWVVTRKPAMRTPRNLFILNLATSDLLLCLVTIPLTCVELLTRYWPLGNNDFVCKIIGPLQALSIFVSTFSIAAISLDRYQLIVNPTRESLHSNGVFLVLGMIWLGSFLMAMPLFMYRKLNFPPNNSFPELKIYNISYCVEDWPFTQGRGVYSSISLIIQYIIPIVTVIVAYSQICRKLQYRYVASSRSRNRDEQRRRTNLLLIAISVVFCISWLPLNIFNMVLDFQNVFGNNHQKAVVVFAVCHMIGMTSACCNPLLYGWLNDNFRKEFKEILGMTLKCGSQPREEDFCDSFRSSLSRKKKGKSKSLESSEKLSQKDKSSMENSIYLDELKTKSHTERVTFDTMTTCLDTTTHEDNTKTNVSSNDTL